MTKAIVISQDKRVLRTDLNGLSDLQAAVDGWIEPVSLRFGTMYVNEEFTYQFGPNDFNSIATDVAGMGGRPDILLQGILGPVVIVGPLDDEGNDTDYTEQAWRAVKRVGREAGAQHVDTF